MPKKNDPYEFNAPQYLDFTQGIPEEADDSYFELAPKKQPTATEDKEPQAAVADQPDTRERTQEPQTTAGESKEPPATTEDQQEPLATTEDQQKPLATTEDQQELPATTEDQQEPPEPAQEPDTPMEDMETETATGESEEPPTAAEEPATAEATATATPAASATKKNRRRSNSLGVRQSPRLIAISKALRRSAAQRSPGSHQPTNTSNRAKGSLVTKVQPQKKVNSRVSGVSNLTQEDKAELNTVATFRQKISNNKRNKKEVQPLKPTKVKEFQFATDTRLRNQTETQAASTAAPPVEFARMLRSSSTATLNKDTAGAASRGPTIPQPFSFESRQHHQQQEPEGPQKFVSMAELNLKFVTGTPERFRTKRAGSVELQEGSKKPRGVTMPHTPKLATSRRRRSLSVMTQEEREIQEFEEAQKHAFKAKPLNKKVFGTPSTGYHVEKKLPTVPEPFHITESKKYQAPSLSESLDIELGDESLVSVLPYGGMSFKGTRSKTKVQPFSFDARDKAKMVQKQQKIQKVLEEEKRLAEFHARPMPVFEDGVHGLPAKKPLTPTQVKPFALRVEQRGSTKQDKFKQQLEKEAQWEEERRHFHAQGDEVVHKMPFLPEKSKKPLTEISNFTLSTEIRAGERSEYELQQKAIEEEMLEAKKREEERRAAEELAEITRLRREAVHKAQPVPRLKPMVIQPSLQPPTVPESPNFATNTRLRSRSRGNSTFSVDSE